MVTNFTSRLDPEKRLQVRYENDGVVLAVFRDGRGHEIKFDRDEFDSLIDDLLFGVILTTT